MSFILPILSSVLFGGCVQEDDPNKKTFSASDTAQSDTGGKTTGEQQTTPPPPPLQLTLDAAIIGNSQPPEDQYTQDANGDIAFNEQLPVSCGDSFGLNLFASDASQQVADELLIFGCAPKNDYLSYEEKPAAIPDELLAQGCLQLSTDYFRSEGTVDDSIPPEWWSVFTLNSSALDNGERSCEEIPAGSENQLEIPFTFVSTWVESSSNLVFLDLKIRGGG